ncbi:MAG: hypothetical protein ACP5MT_02400 [Candidatus Acidifodinimicrobium sp.]
MARKINKELYYDILSSAKDEYITGYSIYKKLKPKYPGLTAKVVYYYLDKMRESGFLSVEKRLEEGRYSWGNNVVKKYYKAIK